MMRTMSDTNTNHSPLHDMPPTMRTLRAVRALGMLVVSSLFGACDGTRPPAMVRTPQTLEARTMAETPRSMEVGDVIEVIDGDTVRLRIGARSEVVRLLGIDTPETKHPTKGEQCFGRAASEYLTRLLPVGTRLRLERDVEARDAYGRLLLYLHLAHDDAEVFVNRHLVARGFARVLIIEPNVHYREDLVAAAFNAQRRALGLWDACK
jgi:micrococcal nuclease